MSYQLELKNYFKELPSFNRREKGSHTLHVLSHSAGSIIKECPKIQNLSGFNCDFIAHTEVEGFLFESAYFSKKTSDTTNRKRNCSGLLIPESVAVALSAVEMTVARELLSAAQFEADDAIAVIGVIMSSGPRQWAFQKHFEDTMYIEHGVAEEVQSRRTIKSKEFWKLQEVRSCLLKWPDEPPDHC